MRHFKTIDQRLWLLHLSVPYIIRLDLVLLDPKSLQEQWNCFEPQLLSWHPSKTSMALVELVKEGKVEIISLLEPKPEGLIPEPLSRAEQIEILGSTRISVLKKHAYRLTDDGVASWESWLKPDWSLYFVNDEIDSGDLPSAYGRAQFICGSEQKSDQVFDNYHSFGDSDPSISLTQKEHSRVVPWDATYFKRLEVGYLVEFTYKKRNGVYESKSNSEVDSDVFFPWGKKPYEDLGLTR